MVIQTNVSALISYRESAKTNRAMKKTLEKLSSGYRINRSADDASGLAVSERMRFYCTEYGRCHTNAKEGLNLAKTADGALAEVNDMLRRARELCIQAENGTYSEQELASISDEMNELFGEIDRITEGSFFNKIQLFRGAVGPDFHYEYDEVFLPVDPVKGTEVWGTIDFVEKGDFDQATPSKQATMTFKLADGITKPMDLDGKTITVKAKDKTVKCYFYDGTQEGLSHRPTVDGPNVVVRTIDLTSSSISDVRAALRSAFNSAFSAATGMYFSYYPTVSIDSQNNVKVTAPLGDITENHIIDGEPTQIKSQQALGAWANGITISGSEGASLEKVGLSTVVYGDFKGSFTLGDAEDGLSITTKADGTKRDEANEIGQNSLVITIYDSTKKELTVPLSGGTFTNGMTKEQVGDQVAAQINKVLSANGYSKSSASYSGGKLNINIENKSNGKTPCRVVIHEEMPYDKIEAQDGPSVSANAVSVSISTTNGEKGERSTITIPSNVPNTNSLDNALGINIGNYTYLYYDSSKSNQKLIDTTYTAIKPGGTYYKYIDVKDASNLTGGTVLSDLRAKIETYARNAGGVIESSSGNTINVRSRNINDTLNLDSRIQGYGFKATAYRPEKKNFLTDHMVSGVRTGDIGTIGSDDYAFNYTDQGRFQQAVSVSFAVNDSNVSGLAGKGFSVNGKKIAFVKDGNPATVPDGYQTVTLTDTTTTADLVDALNGIMNPTSTSTPVYKVKYDSGKITFSWDKPARTYQYYSTDNVTVSDGHQGSIIKEGGTFKDGADTGHSQKKIDFSSVTAENMDDLLGSGFRINCASCTGEFINVLFCHDKGDMPESFEIKVDKNTGNRLPNDATGDNVNTVTIRNYAVELSKISSPQQIVSSIVQQLSGQLDHFTTVGQDPDNPLILLAQDKRYGVINYPAPDSRGSVEGGIEANFTYSVNIRKVEDYPEDGSVALKNNNVEIYVGSEPDPQIIPIHLPYIDLKTLRLRPPETVDLNDAEQDASNWLNRVDQANLFISKSRGVIGADHNRLESAVQALSHAKENITDAESRIRDTDMAEEMMEHIKLQILTQSQQSMLSQAMAQPQQVLRLIS